MMRDLLIVERNEAQMQRKEVKALHENAVAIFQRILKFNERMHRRAQKRHLMTAAELGQDAHDDSSALLVATNGGAAATDVSKRV